MKLGYGGTQSEMQRLIKDAAALDSSIDANSMSFANIVKAINVVQTEMGITGTTAKEAGRTIEGSVNAMKSAWTNLLTGLADGSADVGELVDNLVTTIVGDGTESNLGVLGNIMPAVKVALGGAAKLVSEIVPEIGMQLPGLIEDFLPMLVNASMELVNGLAESLPNLLPILINAIIVATPAIIAGILKAFHLIIEVLPELIRQISDYLPELTPQIIKGMVEMVAILVENLPEILSSLFDALIVLFVGAWNGIQDVFSLSSVSNFFKGVWNGIKGAFGSVASWFRNVFQKAWEGVKSVFSSGGKIFDGIKDGISDVFKTVVNSIIRGINTVISIPFNAINGFLRTLRNVNILGVTPFTWIREFNVPQIPLLWRGGVLEKGQIGLLEGNGAEAVVPLENNHKWISKVADDMARELKGGNTYNISVTVNGAKYNDEDSLANAIALKIQNMTDRRSAVYA